jgi:hypothetical protein
MPHTRAGSPARPTRRGSWRVGEAWWHRTTHARGAMNIPQWDIMCVSTPTPRHPSGSISRLSACMPRQSHRRHARGITSGRSRPDDASHDQQVCAMERCAPSAARGGRTTVHQSRRHRQSSRHQRRMLYRKGGRMASQSGGSSSCGDGGAAIDMAKLIFIMNQATKRRPTRCRNRIARLEQLSTSEAHESTTKSDGM